MAESTKKPETTATETSSIETSTTETPHTTIYEEEGMGTEMIVQEVVREEVDESREEIIIVQLDDNENITNVQKELPRSVQGLFLKNCTSISYLQNHPLQLQSALQTIIFWTRNRG